VAHESTFADHPLFLLFTSPTRLAMRALSLAELLLLELAKPSELPLRRRIYEAVRDAITEGVLPPGARLPSSRDLARDLDMSRNTVVSAIDDLLAEGYTEARIGSGTYVAREFPERQTRFAERVARSAAPAIAGPNGDAGRTLSARGTRLTELSGYDHLEVQPFSPGVVDYDSLPLRQLNQIFRKFLSRARPELLDCGEPGGFQPLREAIARYLKVSRSVNVTADQVLITTSTQQSLDLCAHLLADAGDTVWLEDPCYWGAQRAMDAAGLKLHAVPVDDDGIAPSEEDWKAKPRLIYVTPSNQYPTGAVLSLERRRRLLDFAAEVDAFILEDDYDSEFRYQGRPLPSLQGMDMHQRVLYLGTFSKVMFQGLRLAYLVVPSDLLARFRIGLYDLYRPGQLAMQAAVAEFIEQGLFEANVRRMRVVYGERRALLRETLTRHLSPDIELSGSNAGMTMVIYLPPGSDDRALAAAALRAQLTVRALADYYVGRRHRPGLVVGFAYVATADIGPWAEALAQLIEGYLSARPSSQLIPEAVVPGARGKQAAP
jgi:GntR family transcriptional regulator/MocR family aminotransferase